MRAGTELAGRYRLERLLGRGGMGEVWRGVDRTLDRPVAIKLLRANLLGDDRPHDQALARFRREGRAAARLSHRNITAVHDFGEHREIRDGVELTYPFLVLEFVRGRDLRSVLDDHPGGLPVERVLDYGAQAADALAAAHAAGVVHRDVKPANLMLLDDGTVKICDFGIARLHGATAGLSATGTVLGTLLYMPPEQLEGRPVDHRADLYAFGATLYHLLTGRPVFSAADLRVLAYLHATRTPDPPSALRPGIGPGAEGLRATPSVVAFAGNGEVLVGEAVRRQPVTDAERTIRSVARHLGAGRTVEIDGRTFTPPQLAAFVLRKLARDAEAYLGERVTDAVISVPACFDETQRQALREAAALAGLTVPRVIAAPDAAALAHGLDRDEETVLVLDLGGGTLDVSLLDVGDGVIEVRATAGDPRLGGDDWDRCLADELVRRFMDAHGVDLSADKAAMERLREAAERAKIELSAREETVISVPYVAGSAGGPLHVAERLTRAAFQRLTAGLLERCRIPLQQVFEDAEAQPADLDRVVLLGGSARMPAVADLVKELTGKEPYRGVDPDAAVAAGAALQAGVLRGEVKDVLLLEVTPLSLGVETKGGIFTKIIQRNTTIPAKRSEVFTTAEDDQPSVQIHVHQGEREIAARNKKLATLELSGLPSVPRGVPRIEVAFDIDANGTVTVSARDLGTGERRSVTLSSRSSSSPTAEALLPVLTVEQRGQT
ncbi:Chaperone protein DnaK [Nonomuraea coxensis DSM 45129]|uniref:Chaperone protein DnaK n=1 Tax=Nonomuraea coxensis DSM 45129 TaxID=1122611 RepID=A0ABX8UHE3_9ACTN|nr:Chaperone protein DnaK [Nonomuraea coxensis DSM 45129]